VKESKELFYKASSISLDLGAIGFDGMSLTELAGRGLGTS